MLRLLNRTAALLILVELLVYSGLGLFIYSAGGPITRWFVGARLAALIAIIATHVLLGALLVALLARGWRSSWFLFILYGVYYFVFERLCVIRPNGPSYKALVKAFEAAKKNGTLQHLRAAHTTHYPGWPVYLLFGLVGVLLIAGAIIRRRQASAV
jgi:hypothetical protein